MRAARNEHRVAVGSGLGDQLGREDRRPVIDYHLLTEKRRHASRD
jgi:hypothetical protein